MAIFEFKRLLLLLLILLTTVGLCRTIEVVSVDVHAAKDLFVTGKHRYLDVRTAEEFNKGHPENAINIPCMFFTPQGRLMNPDFMKQVHEIYKKDDFIVVGCKSGVRSLHASVDLILAGFKHIKDVAGGYDAWVENGFLVKKREDL